MEDFIKTIIIVEVIFLSIGIITVIVGAITRDLKGSLWIVLMTQIAIIGALLLCVLISPVIKYIEHY